MDEEQHGASAVVGRSGEQEQSPPAHETKKMRTDDDDVELFTTVHNEIAEITGDLLPADLMHAAHEK